MTLQQLQYIVAVDDTGQFSKAAAHCFVTQPTLTMMVRKLEDELGITVFRRRARPLSATPEGAEVIAQARRVLHNADQLRDLVNELRTEVTGTYRIGVLPTLAPYLLPLFLTRFAQAHPKASFILDERKTAQVLEGLRSGHLDMGLIAGPVTDVEVEAIPVFQEPFLAYVPSDHPLLRKKLISPEDLHGEPLWVLSEGHCLRAQALSICREASSAGHGNIRYDVGSIETLKRMVRAGSGLTLVPELSVDEGDVNVRRFKSPQPVREVVLVVRKPYARRKTSDALVRAVQASLPKRLRALREEVVPAMS